MGVKGLHWLIAKTNLQKPYKLHDTYVAIDGDNLIYPLYFDNKINFKCGGDYDRYAQCIRKYFNMLHECNIKPVIVFDGGYDKSGRKMKTFFKNINERLSSCKNIALGKKYSTQIFPILGRTLFISILEELNIPFVVSDSEADSQVAAVANYYKCPVISDDSDFFVFDVHNGFITRWMIETSIILDIDSNGRKYKYLQCCIYHIDDFLSCFPEIEKTVIPLLATLMGNDYAEQEEFDDFFTNIKLPREGRIDGLLNWLQGKSLNDAIDHILQCLSDDKLDYIKSIIEVSIASYNLCDSYLVPIIDKKLNYSKCELLFDSQMIPPCENSLPLEFSIKYHSGHYTSSFPDIIVLHKSFLTPKIDDFNCCSSYMCARFIRRVTYGILISHDADGNYCQHEKCLMPIEEYDRHEESFDKEVVEPIFFLESTGALPNINELSSLKEEKAKLILMEVLGINLDFVQNLPAEWQLFIASINYFLHNCVPCCTEAFMYALILILMYGDLIMSDNLYKNAFGCYPSYKTYHKCSSIPCIISKISQLEVQNAAKKFKFYSLRPWINDDHPLCLKIVHNYNQFQSCLLSAIELNKLLGRCMKNPDIERYLNGSLLYNLTKDIFTWSDPELFVAGILGRRTVLYKIFALLDTKIRHDVPSHYILKNAVSC